MTNEMPAPCEQASCARCLGPVLVSAGISLFVGIWSGIALVGEYSGWQAGWVLAYTLGVPVALCALGFRILRDCC